MGRGESPKYFLIKKEASLLKTITRLNLLVIFSRHRGRLGHADVGVLRQSLPMHRQLRD